MKADGGLGKKRGETLFAGPQAASERKKIQ